MAEAETLDRPDGFSGCARDCSIQFGLGHGLTFLMSGRCEERNGQATKPGGVVESSRGFERGQGVGTGAKAIQEPVASSQ